jgi:CspA family cold shock protein
MTMAIAASPYQQGVIKSFSQDKGFGFITPDDGTADVFFHFTSVASVDLQKLSVGQKVRYMLDAGSQGTSKGLSAVQVTLL